MSSPIKDVSDTAFWIAYHRALETERSDALFRDPFAARLAGDRGREISEKMPTSRIVAWTVAIRTRIIDEFIMQAIAAGADTILNLGAGLDARPYRMELPSSLRWVEADYAHVIEYKEVQLAGNEPRCHLERVKINLADRIARKTLLDRVNAQSGFVFVLTEGVIPYLSNDEVASLADELRAMDHMRLWTVDYFSAQGLRYRRRREVGRAMGNAPFKFEPGDWFAFFKDCGWQVREMRYFSAEAQKFSRPIPLPAPLRFLIAILRPWMSPARREAFLKLAGYALLEPAQSEQLAP